MSNPDTESLIARLSGGLDPSDRKAFRHAAETTLASSPQCGWGPGSAYRALVPLWRNFFHPPFSDHGTVWDTGRKPSKLVNAPPHSQRRRSRNPWG